MIVLKVTIKIIFAFILVALSLKLAIFFSTRKADDFCESIKKDSSVRSVEVAAKELGYDYFEKVYGSHKKYIISTQGSPFFRFSCVVTYEKGILIDKKVIADD
jgi:hypothetical protein